VSQSGRYRLSVSVEMPVSLHVSMKTLSLIARSQSLRTWPVSRTLVSILDHEGIRVFKHLHCKLLARLWPWKLKTLAVKFTGFSFLNIYLEIYPFEGIIDITVTILHSRKIHVFFTRVKLPEYIYDLLTLSLTSSLAIADRSRWRVG